MEKSNAGCGILLPVFSKKGKKAADDRHALHSTIFYDVTAQQYANRTDFDHVALVPTREQKTRPEFSAVLLDMDCVQKDFWLRRRTQIQRIFSCATWNECNGFLVQCRFEPQRVAVVLDSKLSLQWFTSKFSRHVRLPLHRVAFNISANENRAKMRTIMENNVRLFWNAARFNTLPRGFAFMFFDELLHELQNFQTRKETLVVLCVSSIGLSQFYWKSLERFPNILVVVL